MSGPRIILITGERQIGKSTVCAKLVDSLRSRRVQVSGLLTRRTGPDDLRVTELHSGATYPLTVSRSPDQERAIPVGHFQMDRAAMRRSENALDAGFPTQVFILDEIGPLELIRGQGWVRALELLRRSRYDVGFIVIRPELLVRAIWQLPVSSCTVVDVTRETRDALPASLLTLVTKSYV